MSKADGSSDFACVKTLLGFLPGKIPAWAERRAVGGWTRHSPPDRRVAVPLTVAANRSNGSRQPQGQYFCYLFNSY